MTERRIPEATVARLPSYLQVLLDAVEGGTATLSSEDLARSAGVTSAKVRKDLSFLGSYGTRGVGYPVAQLAAEISRVLGLSGDRPLVIVGVGNLGRALASYDGFTRRGFRLVGLLDADPTVVGATVGGLHVAPMEDLDGLVAEHGVSIAVVATPAPAAQAVADRLVDAGVTAILNFAPTHLDVPDEVHVRTVDVSTELQILSFYEQLTAGLASAAG